MWESGRLSIASSTLVENRAFAGALVHVANDTVAPASQISLSSLSLTRNVATVCAFVFLEARESPNPEPGTRNPEPGTRNPARRRSCAGDSIAAGRV